MSKARDVKPDDLAKARDAGDEGIGARDQEDDVEGHSMLISPTLGRELAKARSQEVDRTLRGKQHEADAKRIFRR
jgi:hypothetical protein